MEMDLAEMRGATDTPSQAAHYPLQEMMLPFDKTVSELYLRILQGYVEVDETHLSLDKGGKVSFNTYFNSFYESYWIECTEISDLQLTVEFEGALVIEVFRDSKHHGCHRIHWKKIKSTEGTSQTIELPLYKDGGLSPAGRLFVDVQAESKANIRRLAFTTRKPPVHQPAITLGICTFNRETFLRRNLEAILGYQDALQAVEKIIVVNQGPSFSNPELMALVDQSDKIKLVEQRNLGGCGGFTRTMHECLEYHEATHHVLMDDDANIDARILRNLENFLSYASQDIVVGGHMLDLLRPWVLYEAGAIVQPNSRLKSLHHNIDLRPLDALTPFNQCHYSDYNAWWFCAIPTKHIEEAQFPAPIFIRGDDMEYGIRMQEKGVKTVAMPGIAVWHEPFYVKVGGWQTYYDLRNRLIMAAVYPHRFKMESPKIVLWMMMQALAMHDYMTAKLLCKAVEDYLYGPELFNKDAKEIHQEVASVGRLLNQESVSTVEGLRTPAIKNMPKSEVGIALLLARRIFMTLVLGGGKGSPVLLMDAQATVVNIPPGPYVKTNGIGSYKLLYRPDRRMLLKALVDCWRIVRRYKAERSDVSHGWLAGIGALRGNSYWKDVFDGVGVAGE